MNGGTRQRPHVNPADLAAHIIAAIYLCQGRTQPGSVYFTSAFSAFSAFKFAGSASLRRGLKERGERGVRIKTPASTRAC